ncbi:S-adenosyl-L-methionine-dependent methyltransferase [Crucibulum laeve]|uniref:S-adenosyl-L-methionine-dependent methyltransferase n=1 Tax=Crucibulum laeve TaxID=68775 RepID=A0A5C3M399_9AGAR|nr:S-adenosyl-L-methionine-dependent methyltransferase [Crucibulum laeve]
MVSTSNGLSALVSLISDATKVIEAEYQRDPHGIPSLEDLGPHPFDTAVYSTAMRNAIQVLEGACAQLCATVGRPSHTMLNKAMGFYEPACLHVVLTFKIPDILQTKPSGMHVSDLAKASGVEQGKLCRILRLLASKHCFREVSRDVFANNRLSLQIVSTEPFYNLALDYVGDNYKWTSELAETLGDPNWGHSSAPHHSSFNKYTKYPRSFFQYLEGDTPSGREYAGRLNLAMIGWGVATESGAVVKDFPWYELPSGASVCDVGGGVGTVSMKLAKAYPHLKFKLQDTPQCIEKAQNDIWPSLYPEAVLQKRIEFKAMDFLVESPIRGCHIYYLKHVIHDWPDEACIKILTGIRNSMALHSRVLIQEYILQPACEVESDQTSSHPSAPRPLLPNYGAGRIRQYNIDLDMMTSLNSQERTLEDFIRLGKLAGLRFVKLWTVGEMGVVELSIEKSGPQSSELGDPPNTSSGCNIHLRCNL